MARDNDGDGSGTGAMTGSTLWWGAGGLILLVLIGLVWVLINVGKSSPAAVATHTVTAPAPSSGAGTPPTARPSTSTSAGNTSGCNVPGGGSLVPTAAIPAKWQLVGSYAVPVSSTVGPKTITGPGGTLRSCYQHSPSGAVVAAMNIALASATSNSHAVLEQGYTAGPGLAEVEALPVDGSNASIAGFLTQACTQTDCLVKIALTVQGQDIESTMPMIWSDGDWKVNGQVTGVAQSVVVSNLSPYTPMSASTNGATS